VPTPGLDIPRRCQTGADPDGDFNGAFADPAVAQEAWAAWREEIAFADHFTREHEHARHNGHADLLRERIDCRVGL
jgi:hypothetical protein